MAPPLHLGAKHLTKEPLFCGAYLGEPLGHRTDGAIVPGQPECPGGLLPVRHVALLAHQPSHMVQALGDRRAAQLREEAARQLPVTILEQLDRRLTTGFLGDAPSTSVSASSYARGNSASP